MSTSIWVCVADQPMSYGEEFVDLDAALAYAAEQILQDTGKSIEYICADDDDGHCWNLARNGDQFFWMLVP